MSDRALLRITSEPLDPSEAMRAVADAAAGAVCVFTGTVRDHSQAGEVSGLQYEAWGELAERRLRDIAGELLEKWPVRRVALLHRTGRLGVGEVSVVVACSAPHRAEAFEACRHGIERVKEELPVWKKEELASGESHWVMGS